MLGDIGYPTKDNYKEFIKYCSNNFKKVFLITGNHEYYCTRDNDLTINQVDNMIEDIVSNYDNVYFLNNSYYEFDDIVILGTTLWSYIDESKYDLIKYYINDYNWIKKCDNKTFCSIGELKMDKTLCLPKDTTLMHNINVKWIKDMLKENKDKQIIILTHHLPSYKAIHPKYKSYSSNCAFASDLDDIMEEYQNIKYWFYGHTHTTTEFKLFSTLCASNPCGYKYTCDNCDNKNDNSNDNYNYENISYERDKVYKL